MIGRQECLPHVLWIERIAGDGGLNLEERFAGGDVERFLVRAAEGEVGDDIFANRNPSQQLAFRRNDIDAGRHVGGFIGGSRRRNAGGDLQIALRIETHSIATAAAAKIKNQALLRD